MRAGGMTAMRLLVDISAHGYGHLSQTAPILCALRNLFPRISFVVRSGLPETRLRERLGDDIEFVRASTDFGCAMVGPFEVDRWGTLERYRRVDAAWDATVEEIAALLRSRRCNGVFTNISYPALAAAKRVGLPSVACSSLIWSEVARHYIGGLTPDADGVIDRICAAYDQASLILRLVPGMPMREHRTLRIDQPIARVGRARRVELRRVLGLDEATDVVLCAFGGMLPERPAALASDKRIALIVPSSWNGAVTPIEALDWPFEDLIASVDAVLSKPGYGIVAELACNATPSILVTRGDWPEKPYLVSWIQQVGRCRLSPRLEDLDTKALSALLDEMRADACRPPIDAGGEDSVAIACRDVFGGL
jgi:hypothetical protein